MFRKITILFCTLWAMTLHASDFTVVIDAGHGGKDAGAVGRQVMEKNLNLDVSLQLAQKIRAAYPEVKVLLTREKDVFITLQGRADFANHNNADLFICIHTNASENRSAHGAETFILGTERLEDNLDVAMRENAVMKLESDYQTTYQGFDPNSVDSYIMFDLLQNQYLDQSLLFAGLVQTEFAQTLHRDDRGVRQAAFWVLLKSACPSVLVEMGFISNKDEEKFLASAEGRQSVVNAIFTAFSKFYGKTPAVSDSVAVSNLPSGERNVAPAVQAENAPAAKTKTDSGKTDKGKRWGVQIFSSKNIVKEGDPTYKGLKNCVRRPYGAWYRYIYGSCASREEAVKLREQIKKKFPDSFVLEYDK